MSEFLTSIAALIVTLGILITFHEFGHFWVARRLGVKVLRFSIGFGTPIWLRRGKIDGTEYAITAIPLGGYVKMLDEREGEVPAHEAHRAFNRQSVWARIAIVFAGPLFNFLFAILAYSLMFMVGVSGTRPLLDTPTPGSLAEAAGLHQNDLVIAVDGEPTPTLDTLLLTLVEQSMAGGQVTLTVQDPDGDTRTRVLDLSTAQEFAESEQLFSELGLNLWRPRFPAIIDQLTPDGAGARAGLAAGDRVLAVDGQPIADWQQWADYIRERPGQPIDIRLQRGTETLSLTATPDSHLTEQGPVGLIGAYGRMPAEAAEQVRVIVRHGPLESIAAAAGKTWDMSFFTLRMLGRMLIGQASLENISGPITIAQFAGQSASIGWVPFLSFLALVSISLGVLNLLPVPVLDGGHLLYYGIELVKGSPLSETAQYLGQRIGIILLLMLMSLAIVNDLTRLFS